jgi:hypothetical protein
VTVTTMVVVVVMAMMPVVKMMTMMPMAWNPIALLDPAPAVPHRSANGTDILNEAAVGSSGKARRAR